MEVSREHAEEIATKALVANDISESDATIVADVLVTADAMGKHSHGLLRLPRYINGITQGNVDPQGSIRIVVSRGGVALLDGGARLGPVVASEAIEEAMSRADQHGIAAVGVHNANHLGMLGYYTDRARRNGYVAIAITNTEPAMPPFGGAEAVLGTNPIAIGFPTDPPFNLDMSTASIARGTILRAAQRGERLPEGVALDEEGQPTTDPEAALEGVILPFGGAKGAGLAIAIEVLAGGFVGAAMGSEVTGTYQTDQPCTKGDLFVVIDPDSTVDDFDERASTFFDRLTAAARAPGVEEIRLPGQRSIERASSRDHIELDGETWETLRELARSNSG